MSETRKPGKHVILLGAGASMKSGYPSAVRLRLLLTSPNEFLKFLSERFSLVVNYPHVWVRSQMEVHRQKYAAALDFFRRGNFATVDEFCEVCGGSHPDSVRAVKEYMGFVLSCVAPEFTFEESEYHAFIRRLFGRDLRTLREDISVLTYNYDPYFEHLLLRAIEVRQKGSSVDPATISGFCSHGPLLSRHEGFCFLKLHGTIALPYSDDGRGIARMMASTDQGKYLTDLFMSPPLPDGPVFFPWEIFKQGQIHPGSDQVTGWTCPGKETFQGVFTDIWSRAREDIQRAVKISFIGLSMHSYLKPGLKYLFEGKSGPLQVVIANPDIDRYAKDFGSGKFGPHQSCSYFRIRRAIHEICPLANLGTEGIQHSSYFLRSFTEFTEREMAPVI